jgi:hypothetical protein
MLAASMASCYCSLRFCSGATPSSSILPGAMHLLSLLIIAQHILQHRHTRGWVPTGT